MKIIEFGQEGRETVLLLHGGGLSWWNYREAAALLEEEYHVLLPVLDGHAGSGRPFTSIEDSAEEIIGWIGERLGGRADLIGGLSLGGQILLEILSRRGDICRAAIVESAMAIPSRLTHALIGPAFGGSWGLIRNRRFAEIQFRSLHMKPELFEDYYRDTCGIEKADMIAFMKASTAYALKPGIGGCAAAVHLYAGGRENPGIRRSAALVKARLPAASLTILPGYRHGEFSINHAPEYAAAVRAALKRTDP